MKTLSMALIFTWLMVLTGCNGSSGDNADSGSSNSTAALSSKLLLNGTAVNQFKADQQVSITATLLNTSNRPLTEKVISFTAELGTLAASSALTNSSGVASVTLTGNAALGAGVITASYDDGSSVILTNSLNYEIIAADSVVIDGSIRIGYFDDDNNFIQGQIKLSLEDNTVSAGGTLGLSVTLIDENNDLITTPTQVTFTSSCVANGNASIDASVFSINGQANATFDDIDCAGLTGIDDQLSASVTNNGITSSAFQTIHISGDQLGSIEFLSAEPTSIALQGSGGVGKQEFSTLTFKVNSALGNPVAQQNVEFSLNTSVGGIRLSPASGLTNSQGEITTEVNAGTVPTSVRVTAKSSMIFEGEPSLVQTQSDLLSIHSDLPEQSSFTIAAAVLNPEADHADGVTSNITVWLADNFNNPAPDGTTVTFTTEGGHIPGSCNTIDGNCFVTWISAQDRVENHRITILATALGHETFYETNGNNTFDDNDGNPIEDASVSSGFGHHNAEALGFIDMSEAWRDDDEDLRYDAGELYYDDDISGVFSDRDTRFNGPRCNGSACASQPSIRLRRAIVLIMSGSVAHYQLTNQSSGSLYADQDGNGSGLPNISDNSSQGFTFSFYDSAGQAMPLDTSVSVGVSEGDIEGTTSFTMPNTNSPRSFDFIIVNPAGGTSSTSVLTITVTTPDGIVTTLVQSFTLS